MARFSASLPYRNLGDSPANEAFFSPQKAITFETLSHNTSGLILKQP